MEPPHRFAFTWFVPGAPKTWVELALVETSTGTRASLTHSGWDQFAEAEIKATRDTLVGGWGGYCLPNLKRLSEAA
jgi:uncharacterized protein YndB with AHSA1/START domain